MLKGCPAAGLMLLAASTCHGLVNLPLGRSYYDGVEFFINVTVNGHSVAVQVDSGSSTLVVPVVGIDGGLPFCAEGSFLSPECVYGSYTPSGVDSTMVENCNTTVPLSYTSLPFINSSACGFAIEYGDDSGIAGAWFQDTLTLADKDGRVHLGAGVEIRKEFQRAPVAGILGIGPPEGNCLVGSFTDYQTHNDVEQCFPTAISEWLAANNLPDIVSLCFGYDKDTMSVLTLGGIDSRLGLGAATIIVPYHDVEYAGYPLAWTELTIGDETSSIDDASLILDSGSTATKIVEPAFKAIMSVLALKANCTFQPEGGIYLGMCLSNPVAAPKDFDLQFLIGNTSLDDGTSYKAGTLTLPVASYMECFDSGNGGFECILHGVASGDSNILGDNMVAGLYVTYDRDAKLVQVQPGACDSCPQAKRETDCKTRGNCVWEQSKCKPMTNLPFPTSSDGTGSTTPAPATTTPAPASTTTATPASTSKSDPMTSSPKTTGASMPASTSAIQSTSSTETVSTTADASTTSTEESTEKPGPTTPKRLRPGQPGNPTGSTPSESKKRHGMGTGATIGVVVGVLLVMGLLTAGFVLTRNKYGRVNQSRLMESTYEDAADIDL
eukprot:m.267771 g.267771  ORF g.267771 m.267771 type:complete len:609 (+) comp17643_c0_seq1:3200-5026(+)